MFKKIYVEITNVCNLNCKFCPPTKRAKEFMALDQFEIIIKQIHNETNLVALHVKGEPLLHPQLDGILKILEKYNLKANITSNGVLLKDKLDIIKNSKSVRQLNISIHSFTENEKLNEKYLDELLNSVEELSNIIISYRLWNLKNLKDNDKNWQIIKKLENYYNIDNLNFKLSDKSFLKIKENVFINQDIEFTWPNINGEPIIEKGRCLALKDQIAILVDGTVVPCCLDNNGDIPLGNIFERSLEEILNDYKSVLIRKNFENSIITCDLCKTCGFLKRLEEKRALHD